MLQVTFMLAIGTIVIQPWQPIQTERRNHMRMLLTTGADAKTVKGQAQGYLTGILYLAPANLSGYQVCPMAAIAKCDIACLNTAGMGAFSNVQKARIERTKMYFEQHDEVSQIKNISSIDTKVYEGEFKYFKEGCKTTSINI